MLHSSVFRVILVSTLLFPGVASEAQNRFEVSTGAGLFEGIFLKAKYGNKVEVGLSQDLLTQLRMTGIEVYYRIPRKYEPALPGPFYFMCGFSTTFFGLGYETFEKSIIYPRVGRSFIISKKSGRVGLNVDLGVSLLRSSNPPEGYMIEFIPFSGSAGFFCRF